MKQSLEYYIDRAKHLHGWHSDAQLSRALDVAPSTIHAWRNDNQRPAEEHMSMIATLSGISPELALLDLKVWKHRGTPLEKSYSLIRDVFQNAIGA